MENLKIVSVLAVAAGIWGTVGAVTIDVPAGETVTRNSVAVPAGEYVAGTTLSGYGVTLSGSNAKIVVAQTGSEIPQTVDDFTFSGTEGYAMTGDLLAKSITLAAGNTPAYRVSGADTVVASLSGTFGFAAAAVWPTDAIRPGSWRRTRR